MITLALEVPLIKMEDGSPRDIWNWDLNTRPWPQLNCQNILFWERRPQLLRAERRRAKDSVLICHSDLEERWAKLAQLFTFYWALTRNKFSFPLSFFEIRSPLLIWVLRTPYWNRWRNWLVIIGSTGQDQRSLTRSMEGSQTPGRESIRHITYFRVGDILALLRN